MSFPDEYIVMYSGYWVARICNDFFHNLFVIFCPWGHPSDSSAPWQVTQAVGELGRDRFRHSMNWPFFPRIRTRGGHAILPCQSLTCFCLNRKETNVSECVFEFDQTELGCKEQQQTRRVVLLIFLCQGTLLCHVGSGCCWSELRGSPHPSFGLQHFEGDHHVYSQSQRCWNHLNPWNSKRPRKKHVGSIRPRLKNCTTHPRSICRRSDGVGGSSVDVAWRRHGQTGWNWRWWEQLRSSTCSCTILEYLGYGIWHIFLIPLLFFLFFLQ